MTTYWTAQIWSTPLRVDCRPLWLFLCQLSRQCTCWIALTYQQKTRIQTNAITCKYMITIYNLMTHKLTFLPWADLLDSCNTLSPLAVGQNLTQSLKGQLSLETYSFYGLLRWLLFLKVQHWILPLLHAFQTGCIITNYDKVWIWQRSNFSISFWLHLPFLICPNPGSNALISMTSCIS